MARPPCRSRQFGIIGVWHLHLLTQAHVICLSDYWPLCSWFGHSSAINSNADNWGMVKPPAGTAHHTSPNPCRPKIAASCANKARVGIPCIPLRTPPFASSCTHPHMPSRLASTPIISRYLTTPSTIRLRSCLIAYVAINRTPPVRIGRLVNAAAITVAVSIGRCCGRRCTHPCHCVCDSSNIGSRHYMSLTEFAEVTSSIPGVTTVSYNYRTRTTLDAQCGQRGEESSIIERH